MADLPGVPNWPFFLLAKGHGNWVKKGRRKKEHGEGNQRAGRDLHHSRRLLWKFTANDGFFGIQIVHNLFSAGRGPAPNHTGEASDVPPDTLVGYPSPFPTPRRLRRHALCAFGVEARGLGH